MELYLMQHGLALPREEDPDEPLSRDGVGQIQAVGKVLRRLEVSLDLIACSPKKRAHQSAALIAEAVNFPHSDILETDLLKALTPPGETLRLVERHADSHAILFAGHLPSLAEIASRVLGNGCRVRVHVENGGLCRLDLPSAAGQQAELRFCLTATQTKMIAG